MFYQVILGVIPYMKKGASSRFFRVSYLRRSRALYHRYIQAKPWVKQFFREFLALKPGMRIVDVGCGTGDFTRYLADLVPGKCQVMGVDTHVASLRAATSETRRAGLSGRVSYKKGDAYAIPLRDDFADITCCRNLLMHLTDPVSAVSEMARITKLGGIVVAVEPGRMRSFYDPEHVELAELDEVMSPAYLEGTRKLEGKEFGIGECLPAIFQEAGVQEIRAEILADAWTPSDTRLKKSHLRATVRFWRFLFKEGREDERRILSAAGMVSHQITRYFRLYDRWLRSLLVNNEEVRMRTLVIGSASFVIAGRKTKPRV